MEINIIGICGSPIKGGNTEVFLQEALKAAKEAGNVNAELMTLAGKEIKECNHCNWCIVKQESDKFCAQSDDMDEIYPKILKADALLVASPVYITRLSGLTACLFDRFRVFAHSKIYGGKLENKVGAALAVSWSRNLGIETTLLSIVSAFFVLGMIPISQAQGMGSAFGAAGLSSEAGTGKFDPKDKLLILKDEFGLKGARSLGKRVVEVSRLLKLGEAAVHKHAGR